VLGLERIGHQSPEVRARVIFQLRLETQVTQRAAVGFQLRRQLTGDGTYEPERIQGVGQAGDAEVIGQQERMPVHEVGQERGLARPRIADEEEGPARAVGEPLIDPVQEPLPANEPLDVPCHLDAEIEGFELREDVGMNPLDDSLLLHHLFQPGECSLVSCRVHPVSEIDPVKAVDPQGWPTGHDHQGDDLPFVVAGQADLVEADPVGTSHRVGREQGDEDIMPQDRRLDLLLPGLP
jgi:hypothetical protein